MIVFVTSIVMLIILMGVGFPVGLAFGGVVFLLVLFRGYDPAFLLSYSFGKLSAVVLVCLPLFILMGNLMQEGKIADYLIDWINTIVSRVRGGMGAVTVITMAIFGAISGTASSAIGAITPILIPRLKKEGYPEGYATAIATTAASLALLVPPSADMIIYGWITGQSITACFLAGMGPGICLATLMIIINYIAVGRMPSVKTREWPGIKKIGKEMAKTTWVGLPAIAMPFIVLGTIYGGIATPTEAAALAGLYCLPVGFFIYRTLNLRKVFDATVKSATMTGLILFMLFFAVMLSRIYITENIPQQIAAFMLSVSQNKYVVLLVVNLFLILMGMIMDDGSAMLISAPMLFPLMVQIGVSPIQFAAIITTNLTMGNMTPPVAPQLYMGMAIGGIDFAKMIKPSLLFLVGAFLPTIVITTYWSPLSLWLPRVILGAKVLGGG